ncbi:hypothetical protein WA158_007957 [Blastocystis sp. Blastoise]
MSALRAIRTFANTSSFYRLASTTAITKSTFGCASKVLQTETVELPELKANQVQVSMIASPITLFDLTAIQGTIPCMPNNHIAGLEGAGRITQVGSSVTGLNVNDSVVFVKPTTGTWAKEVVVDSCSLYKIPTSINPELAAGIVGAPSIAYRILNDFATLEAGDVVIQNAANTSVGHAIVQLCKAKGIKTINIIPESSEYENEFRTLETIGADIICRETYVGTPAFKKLLSDLPAAKLAVDGMGGIVGTNTARNIKNATLVSYADISRQAMTIPSSLLISNNVTLKGFNLYQWLENASCEDVNTMMSSITSLVETDKLRVFLKKDKFSEFKNALEASTEPFASRTILMMMQE